MPGNPVELPRPLTQGEDCLRGGMVDTVDLKSIALTGVPVRVRPEVFHQIFCFWMITVSIEWQWIL